MIELMGRIVSILGVIALGLGLLLALGFLSRKELAHATAGVQSHIPSTLNLLRSCKTGSSLEHQERQSLIIYLTIEMQMRPALWRQAEFLLAGIGAPIKTIGVGQIGFGTFAKYYIADEASRKKPTRWMWISELWDDCKNIEVLAWTIRHQSNPCFEEGFGCALRSACRLHSAVERECVSKPSFLKYRMAAATVYSEITDSRTLGSQTRTKLDERLASP